MRKPLHPFHRLGPASMVLACTFLWLSAVVATAQNSLGAHQDSTSYRAERAAKELVSLSPEKIFDIFKNEPGLVLAFKRTLVRKAYEEGRLLD